MKGVVKLHKEPHRKACELLAAWPGIGNVALIAARYIKDKLKAEEIGEIEPFDFFDPVGIMVKGNIIEAPQFPESKFYAFPAKNLLVLNSTPPDHEWYNFFNLVLHLAQNDYNVKEIYTIGGMISLGAHTAPRQFSATLNSPELKKALSSYELTREVNYETPPGQKPTLNSFFLWAAKRRNIPGANLWVPVPFYLLSVEDPNAQKRILEFLNHRLDLNLDFTALDAEINQLDDKMERMRNDFPEIDQYIRKLESNLRLNEGENEKLVKQVEKFLKETT